VRDSPDGVRRGIWPHKNFGHWSAIPNVCFFEGPVILNLTLSLLILTLTLLTVTLTLTLTFGMVHLKSGWPISNFASAISRDSCGNQITQVHPESAAVLCVIQ